MGGIGNLLATNPAVVAMANLGGLIGLGLVVWAVGKRSVAFAKSLHQNTIRGALRALKFKRIRYAKWLATDVHLFLVALASRALMLSLATVTTIVGMGAPGEESHVKLISLPPAVKDVLNILVDTVYPLVAITLMFLIAADTGETIHLVWRQRVRILRDRRRAHLKRTRALAVEP